jgi:hypothetical protein
VGNALHSATGRRRPSPICNSALELDPTSATAAFNAALVHLARAEESEAWRAYTEAVTVAASLDPDHRRSQLDAARRHLNQLRSQRRELTPLIQEIDNTLATAESAASGTAH